MTDSNHSKKAKISPIIIIGVSLLILAGMVFVLKGDKFAKLEAFPAASFLDGPTDFLGNEYLMRAQIDSQLKWKRGTGRLLAVTPEGIDSRIPVFIPDALEQNVQSGQRFEMFIRIEEGGLIYVEDLRKY